MTYITAQRRILLLIQTCLCGMGLMLRSSKNWNNFRGFIDKSFIQKAVLAASIVFATAGHSFAFSLLEGSPIIDEDLPFGSGCGVQMTQSDSNDEVSVLIYFEGGYAMPEQNLWYQYALETVDSAISSELIGYCLGETVTNLVQNGADNGTVEDDDYIGFSFDAGGFHYEYAIKGATNSYAVNTKAGVVAPPAAPAPATTTDLQKSIVRHMYGRANQLIANQPNLIDFLERQGRAGTSIDANIQTESGRITFASDPSKPLWARMQGAWSTDGGAKNNYGFATIGSHVEYRKNLLLGAMLQIDHLQTQDDYALTRSNGWMVGPYFVAKSAQSPLYLEGRLMYGKTANSTTPTGGSTDTFDTQRVLAKIKASGEMHKGKTTLNPFFDFTYTSDWQNGFTGAGGAVPDQRVTIQQLALGITFTRPINVAVGTLELTGGLSGIVSNVSGVGGMAEAIIHAFTGQRGRIDLGLHYSKNLNENITLMGFYDGLGSHGYKNTGLQLSYELKF